MFNVHNMCIITPTMATNCIAKLVDDTGATPEVEALAAGLVLVVALLVVLVLELVTVDAVELVEVVVLVFVLGTSEPLLGM
jgi:hypothetical protein